MTCTTTTRTVVNERSTLVLRVAFFDEDGNPAVPDSATCRIDDTVQGRTIRSATAVDLGSPPTDTVDITITMKDADFVNFINKKLSGQMAFMTGKLKVKGNMQLAMKLNGLI